MPFPDCTSSIYALYNINLCCAHHLYLASRVAKTKASADPAVLVGNARPLMCWPGWAKGLGSRPKLSHFGVLTKAQENSEAATDDRGCVMALTSRFPAASRMESAGFPMCVHVSEATRRRLGDVMEWIDFGTREIKGARRPPACH